AVGRLLEAGLLVGARDVAPPAAGEPDPHRVAPGLAAVEEAREVGIALPAVPDRAPLDGVGDAAVAVLHPARHVTHRAPRACVVDPGTSFADEVCVVAVDLEVVDGVA